MSLCAHAKFWLAGLIVLFATLSSTAEPLDTRRGAKPLRVQDVSLTDEGKLVGRVLNRQGRPDKNLRLAVHSHRHDQAIPVVTDADGRFAVIGLRGGEYSLATMNETFRIRVWSKRGAPPKARKEVLLVTGPAIRGQGNVGTGHFDGSFLRLMSHPGIVSGLTAAAIAVPIAVDDNDAS